MAGAVAGAGSATGLAFRAARRLSEDEFKQMSLPGGICINEGGVCFAPQKEQKVGGCPVPCMGGKTVGDKNNRLHEA